MESQGKGKMSSEGHKENISLLKEWLLSDESETSQRERKGHLIHVMSAPFTVQKVHQAALLSEVVEFLWIFLFPSPIFGLLDCSLQTSLNTTRFDNTTLLSIGHRPPCSYTAAVSSRFHPTSTLLTSLPYSNTQLIELAVLWHQVQRMKYACSKLWSEYQ